MIQMNIKIHISLAMSALLVASCSSSDDNIQQMEQTPILLTSSVGLQTRTAVQDDRDYDIQYEQIEAGTANVGVCVVRNDNATVIADNKAYNADGDGALNPNDDHVPGFPTDGALVNIYAYAPYQSSLSYSADGTYPFSVATDQSSKSAYISSDLLLGTPPGNPLGRRESAVNLIFKHALAQVRIEIEIGSTLTMNDFIGAKLTTCSMTTDCTFSLKNKSVTANTSSAQQPILIATFTEADIEYYNQPDNERKIRALFITIPQVISEGTALLTLTPGPDAADRTPLVYTLPADRTFTMESGKCSELSLKAGTKPDLTLVSSTIKPWDGEDDTPGTGNAVME